MGPPHVLAALILLESGEFRTLRGPLVKREISMKLPSPATFVYLICLVIISHSLVGCRAFHAKHGRRANAPTVLPNPLPVPLVDRWYVMEQVSDELDDYFRIYREERIRLVDNVMTEGWIETHPKVGGTILEPWHKDSTRGFERLHASLR